MRNAGEISGWDKPDSPKILERHVIREDLLKCMVNGLLRPQSLENLISDVADSVLGIVKSKSRQSHYISHLMATIDGC